MRTFSEPEATSPLPSDMTCQCRRHSEIRHIYVERNCRPDERQNRRFAVADID